MTVRYYFSTFLQVGEQIADLIRNTFLAKRANTQNGQSIPLFELEHLYRRQYGYALRPEDFGQSSLKGVIGNLFFIFFKFHVLKLKIL